MGLVPYNLDPQYSVEKIKSQTVTSNRRKQHPPFLYDLKSFFKTLTTNLKYCFVLPKIYV